MPENFLENATGFQVFDAPLGGAQTLIGGGTFGGTGVSSFTPTANAPASAASSPLSFGQNIINSISSTLFGRSSPSAPNSSAPAGAASSGGTPSQGGSTNPGQSVTASASTPGTLQNYFMRAVVIIVGFIFLAIGLHMLAPSVVPAPGNLVR